MGLKLAKDGIRAMRSLQGHSQVLRWCCRGSAGLEGNSLLGNFTRKVHPQSPVFFVIDIYYDWRFGCFAEWVCNDRNTNVYDGNDKDNSEAAKPANIVMTEDESWLFHAVCVVHKSS